MPSTSLTPAAPRAVLIDLDNTAYAYEPCHAVGLAEAQLTAASLNPAWSDPRRFASSFLEARSRVKSRLAGTAASRCRLLYFKEMLQGHTSAGVAGEAVRRLHDAYWRGYFRQMHPRPGCRDALDRMAAAGLKLAWVTNFTTERQILKLERLGLLSADVCLVTSEEAGREKPAPQVVELAVARLGVHPRDTWFVGDDLHEDRLAASAAGVSFLWLALGDGDGGDVPRVDSFAELARLALRA